MSKDYEFIKDCGCFFIVTINGDFPACRPFGAIILQTVFYCSVPQISDLTAAIPSRFTSSITWRLLFWRFLVQTCLSDFCNLWRVYCHDSRCGTGIHRGNCSAAVKGDDAGAALHPCRDCLAACKCNCWASVGWNRGLWAFCIRQLDVPILRCHFGNKTTTNT